MGRIAGIYGVSGWVRIMSYTRPRENIFYYKTWYVRQDGQWVVMTLKTGRQHGKGLIASLQDIDDRESARALINAEIAIERGQLPALPEGEYYWCDLIGLSVTNQAGIPLGKVDEIYETGANDVLAIAGEKRILFPLIQGTHVLDIDLKQGMIRIDWRPENE